MALHATPTEQQGQYRYDPTHLDQKGPARIFPYAGEDGVIRYILTRLRQDLLDRGQLSQPLSLLLEQFEKASQTLEESWIMLSTLLADWEIFQSNWFNFTLPPNEQFDSSFMRLRREMGEVLRSARRAAEAAGADGFLRRSRFYQELEAKGRSRPLLSRIHERDGGLSDREFARQRIAGQNPIVLRRWQANAGEDDPQLLQAWAEQPYRLKDGSTIQLVQAAESNRLFVADYPLLAALTPADLQPGRYVGSPTALFYRTESGLTPVLIQVDKGRVVTPDSQEADAWMRAKLCVQTADVTHHELISHLCYTHLRMEAFAIATPRQLPPNHPLYQLLRPHFQFLLAINTRGNTILLGEGAAIDNLMAPIRAASLTLINQAYQKPFQFHSLPNYIQRQGVEPEYLPDFPYRDDALLLWEAIAWYVTRFLHRYYPDDQAVEQDSYLQAWAEELGAPLHSRPRSEFPQAPVWLPKAWSTQLGLDLEQLPSHARVPDFPSVGVGQMVGKITSLRQLIEIATQIIFTCGPQHAAVNFSQFDYVGYVPNAPFALYGRPDTPATLDDLLPSPAQELGQMELAFALSGIVWGKLGSSELIQFPDRGDRQVLEQFQFELSEVEAKIHARNQQRLEDYGVDYPYLLPSRIPNSINI